MDNRHVLQSVTRHKVEDCDICLRMYSTVLHIKISTATYLSAHTRMQSTVMC